jgi:hypothetical protein
MVKIVADEVVKEVNSIQSKVQVSNDPKIQEKFPEDFDIKNEVKLDLEVYKYTGENLDIKNIIEEKATNAKKSGNPGEVTDIIPKVAKDIGNKLKDQADKALEANPKVQNGIEKAIKAVPTVLESAAKVAG